MPEVRLLGPLSQRVGSKVVEIEVETLGELLERLKELLKLEDTHSIRVYVNGKESRFIDKSYRFLPEDEVMVLSAVGGG